MLTKRLCYMFANPAVHLLLFRNTTWFFFDTEKVFGTRKTVSQDGLMFVFLLQVAFILISGIKEAIKAGKTLQQNGF